jgi:general secretion pathway protein G
MNPPEPTTPNPETAPAVHRSSLIVHRSSQRGFSLIELIVVVTIIGILAGIALINVGTAQRKARETALRENLHQMRKAIDNFYADKQRYPADLQELVPNYIRKIPKDPITMQDDWETIMDDPMSLEGGMSETDPEAFTAPGVIDVKSRAEGVTLDNVPYPEL